MARDRLLLRAAQIAVASLWLFVLLALMNAAIRDAAL